MRIIALALVALSLAAPAVAQKKKPVAEPAQKSTYPSPFEEYGVKPPSPPAAAPDAMAPDAINGITLDSVMNFPEDFENQTFALTFVAVDGEISRNELDTFCIRLTDRATGKFSPLVLLAGKPSFVISKDMARQFQSHVAAKDTVAAGVRCTVKRFEIGGRSYWIGLVSRIDLLGLDGSVKHRIAP